MAYDPSVPARVTKVVDADATKGGASRPGSVRVLVPMPTFTGAEPCNGADSAQFFPPDDVDGNEAVALYRMGRRYCDHCPIVQACGDYALAHEEHGLWGGLSPKQRERIRRERNWFVTTLKEIPIVFGDRHMTLKNEELEAWLDSLEVEPEEEEPCLV